jgi:hypothetical protein
MRIRADLDSVAEPLSFGHFTNWMLLIKRDAPMAQPLEACLA